MLPLRRNLMKKLLTFVFALLVMVPSLVIAAGEDEGLYDPVAPEGSAFVRLLNVGEGEVDFSTDGKSRFVVAGGDISPYVVQKKGAFKAEAGGLSVDVVAEEGAYYTIFAKDGVLTSSRDMAVASRAKAMVMFYNLTAAEGVSLKTADGKVEIIAQLPVGGSAGREMNSVKVSIGAFSGVESLASLKDAVIERGNAYAIVAMPDAQGTVSLHMFKASTSTVK